MSARMPTDYGFVTISNTEDIVNIYLPIVYTLVNIRGFTYANCSRKHKH